MMSKKEDKKFPKIRHLFAHEIQCRYQVVKSNGFSLLLYKDARCDMNILDEVFGSDNWERTYDKIGDSLFCTVSIRFAGSWIKKQDVGTESNMDSEKGQASDAFKRACFNWGIGRELYTAPFIWIQAKDGEVVQKKDKYYVKPSVKLSVKDITIKDGHITHVVIEDQDGNVRFNMKEKVLPEKPELPELTPDHEKWNTIIDKMVSGTDIETVKEHFILTKGNEDRIKAEVMQITNPKREER
jgi:hypothetical protein